MMQKKLRPPFKVNGSKHYLAGWIVKHFPANYKELDYIEPFAGAASVLLTKDMPVNDKIEVLNDSDLGIVQIFRALRDEPEPFIKRLKTITYSDRVFERELTRSEFEDYLDHAIREFVIRRMSRAGEMKAFAWSDRERGGHPSEINAWKTILEELPFVSDRLKSVRLMNKNGHEVIRSFSDENTFCYCDPSPMEDNEGNIKIHHELWQIVSSFSGKVMVSGQPCSLYNRLYKGWNKVSNKDGRKAKPDVLWMNY